MIEEKFRNMAEYEWAEEQIDKSQELMENGKLRNAIDELREAADNLEIVVEEIEIDRELDSILEEIDRDNGDD